METVLRELGTPGRYQLIQIIATCLCVTLYSFAYLNFVFIGYEPSSRCQFTNETELLSTYENHTELSVSYGACLISILSNHNRSESNGQTVADLRCTNGYSYQQDQYVSMVSEWDLVCDRSGVVGFVQTSITLGLAIGTFLVPSLADRCGRKYSLMFCIAAGTTTELGFLLIDNIYTAIGLRFFSGFFIGGTYIIHNVMSLELLISKHRQIYGACNAILWAANLMLLGGVGFALRHSNWRYLQLITVLSGVPAFLVVFLLNETPTWLVAQNQYDQAQKVIMKACKTNGKDVTRVLAMFREYFYKQAKSFEEKKLLKQSSSLANVKDSVASEIYVESSSRPSANYSLIDILKNRKFVLRVSALCFVWFSCTLTYVGLFLYSSNLAGDRFLNFFLMAFLEVPSSLLNMFLLVHMGRRTVVLMFIALAGACLLVSTCLVVVETDNPHQINASTAFFLLGKMTLSSGFNVLVSYTPELFPTTIRSSGTGLCAAVACLGSMSAPFLNQLFKLVKWGPGAVLSGLSCASFLLFWTMPETREKELPTTIIETMNW